MGISRQIFIIILSFVFLSSLMAPVFCAAKERSPDRTRQNSCLNGQDKSYHEHPSADNKNHCPGQSHFCCYSAIHVQQFNSTLKGFAKLRANSFILQLHQYLVFNFGLTKLNQHNICDQGILKRFPGSRMVSTG